MEVQARTLKLNGLDMFVASPGAGPEVLLLHGFPDSHRVWRHQMQALADAGYRVIAPDLRGYGRTDAPADVHAYAVWHLRDALDIDKILLVGHDWGAVIAWQVCMHAPGRVERLVALSAGHPAAFRTAGLAQRLKSFYMLVFQARGVAERLLMMGGWFFMRQYIRDQA